MKKLIILIVLTIMIFTNVQFAEAIYQAEINPGEKSISYGVQVLDSDVVALTLEGDMTLTPTIGVVGLWTYDEFVDLDVKIKMIDDYDFDMSGLIGYHIPLDEREEKKKLGLLLSKELSEYMDLNAGASVLLGQETDYFGFEFGFDYMLTRELYAEFGYRKLAGSDSEGLRIAIRNYF